MASWLVSFTLHTLNGQAGPCPLEMDQLDAIAGGATSDLRQILSDYWDLVNSGKLTDRRTQSAAYCTYRRVQGVAWQTTDDCRACRTACGAHVAQAVRRRGMMAIGWPPGQGGDSERTSLEEVKSCKAICICKCQASANRSLRSSGSAGHGPTLGVFKPARVSAIWALQVTISVRRVSLSITRDRESAPRMLQDRAEQITRETLGRMTLPRKYDLLDGQRCKGESWKSSGLALQIPASHIGILGYARFSVWDYCTIRSCGPHAQMPQASALSRLGLRSPVSASEPIGSLSCHRPLHLALCTDLRRTG